MQSMEEWLYSGDENVYVKSILEDKAKGLNELGTKIYKRYHDWERLKESLFKLNRSLNEIIQKSKDISQSVNLSQSDKEEIAKLLNDHSNLSNQTENQINTLPKTTEPPQRWEDVEKKTVELDKVNFNFLFFRELNKYMRMPIKEQRKTLTRRQKRQKKPKQKLKLNKLRIKPLRM